MTDVTPSPGTTNVSSAQLLTALLTTSAVFWLLHVYVRMVAVELPLHVPWLALGH